MPASGVVGHEEVELVVAVPVLEAAPRFIFATPVWTAVTAADAAEEASAGLTVIMSLTAVRGGAVAVGDGASWMRLKSNTWGDGAAATRPANAVKARE